MLMPLHLSLSDIAIRLLLTMLAGIVIGIERETRGHAAGLRTTVLVGLAASVAMIQANILLQTGGRTEGAFADMDILRLPLGILTGVGFIGAGVILKRGDVIIGTSTAVTLWVMTAIGLAFGGGQLILGGAATGLAMATLWGLRWLGRRIPREHIAVLVLSDAGGDFALADIHSLLEPLGYSVRLVGKCREPGERVSMSFKICWSQKETEETPADLLEVLERNYTVKSIEIMESGH